MAHVLIDILLQRRATLFYMLPAVETGANLPPMVGAVIDVRVSTREQTET